MRKYILILFLFSGFISTAQIPLSKVSIRKFVPSGGLQDLTFNTATGFTHPSTGLWGGTSGVAWGSYSLATQTLPAGADGWIELQYATTNGNRCMMAFNLVNTKTTWDAGGGYLAAMYIYDAVLNFIDNNGAPSSTGHTMVIGEWARIIRTGTVTKLQSSTDHTTWSDRQTYTTTSTADFYVNGDLDVVSFSTNQLQYPKINLPIAYGARIVCDGNSLTYGANASNQLTTSYPGVMQAEPNLVAINAKVYNKGVNGQTTQQMQADAATDIDPLYTRSVRSMVVFWEGGNDFSFNNIIADSVYAHIVRYCTERRAVGFKIVAVTIPYRDQTLFTNSSGLSDAAYDAERLAVNAMMMSGWTTFADAIVDLASKPGFTSYNPVDGYYHTDHLHFTDLGYSVIEGYIYGAVKTLW